MSDSDDVVGDEDRPATEADCIEPSQDLDEAETSFTRDDELQEAFNPGPTRYVTDDTDGMPRPVIDDVLLDAHAPPFLPEKNQICHELSEEFVVRNRFGEILMRWRREDVRRTPNGEHWAEIIKGKPCDALLEHLRALPRGPDETVADWIIAERVHAVFMSTIPSSPDLSIEYPGCEFSGEHESLEVKVQPLRPACSHLVLQLVPPAQSQAHIYKQGQMSRYCSVRRSVAGAFLCLSQEEMKACSMRDPFDLVSGEMLSYFDRTLAEKSRNRTYGKMFNVKEDREHDEDKPLQAFEEATAAIIAAAKEPTP
jgi:hypothetical protein